MERTLIILKPDAVQRGLCGEILTRFEKKGLQIVGMKAMKIPQQTAETHYAPHKGKPFYEGLVKFMTSSPEKPRLRMVRSWSGKRACRYVSSHPSCCIRSASALPMMQT